MTGTADTTPLLVDSEPLEAGEYEIQDLLTPTQKTPYRRAIAILTHLSVAFSTCAFFFDAVALIINAAGPHGYYMFWYLQERVQGMLTVGIIASIISAINLVRLRRSRRPLWLWLNLVLDGAIAYYTMTLGPDALIRNFDESPSFWLPDEGAAATATAVEIILGFGLCCGLVVGLVHLVLFPLRCYSAYKSGFWGFPRTWRIPAGEFRIEFRVGFLRPEDMRDSGSRAGEYL